MIDGAKRIYLTEKTRKTIIPKHFPSPSAESTKTRMIGSTGPFAPGPKETEDKECMMPRWIWLIGLVGCVGCAGNQQSVYRGTPGTVVADAKTRVRQMADQVLPKPTLKLQANSNQQLLSNGREIPNVSKPWYEQHTENRNSDFRTVSHQVDEPAEIAAVQGATQVNLPTALAMVDGQHPAVGLAQWRVQEAYAQLAKANVLWLPSIQTGFSFDRHDGNLQESSGRIIDVNRNSFQYGLGVGATGAGTTQKPGLVAQFHMADAIFLPEIAQSTACARSHAAKAILNEQLRNVALAYLELIDAHQDARILEDTRHQTAVLYKLTADFAATGQGLQADADRLETELVLVESRNVASQERIQVASARLAQELSIDANSQLVPLDPTVIPINLVPMNADKSSMIGTGLANRPELRESQALVAAACEAYKRQKYSPFVPSLLLGFSTGGFGGGLGNNLDNIDNRYDFDALVSWEVRNLGLGERAARRGAASRVEQAKFDKIRVLDQVAREISEAYTQVVYRTERIEISKLAIQSAENSHERNLSRIRDGQGLPLEVLQSVRALEESRRAYLKAVVEHNEAQFRLQWAIGWPESSDMQTTVGM